MTRLSINECASVIGATGASNTYVVRGEMGVGKSAILHMLAERLPLHRPVMFDCAIASVGDLFLPYINSGLTHFAPTVRMGIRTQQDDVGAPLLICLDEIGKSAPDVINALLPLLLERRLAEHSLPAGSIVFGTSNNDNDALGDSIPPHARNRMGTLHIRKPTVQEWALWALDNNVSPEVIAWAEATPSCMESHVDIKSPGDNPFIYHPDRGGDDAFVSPRSLAQCSGPIAKRGDMSGVALSAALSGIVGYPAASDMRAYLAVGSDNPSITDIINDPDGTKMPGSGIASVVLALSLVQSCNNENISSIVRYSSRMNREAQRVFLLRLKSSSRYQSVMHNEELSNLLLKHRG